MNCVRGHDWGRPPRGVLTSKWGFFVFVICHIHWTCLGFKKSYIWWWPSLLNKYGGLAPRSPISDWSLCMNPLTLDCIFCFEIQPCGRQYFFVLSGGSVCVLHGLGIQALPFYVLYYFVHHIPAGAREKKAPWVGLARHALLDVHCQKRCSILESRKMNFSWAGRVWLEKLCLSTTEPEAAPSDR